MTSVPNMTEAVLGQMFEPETLISLLIVVVILPVAVGGDHSEWANDDNNKHRGEVLKQFQSAAEYIQQL